MEEKTVCIVVATHKNYEMPTDKMYLPLHVGAMGKPNLGYAKDCTGDNISYLNSCFCELTGLYWAWKNLDNDYIGLVHYRRHFVGQHNGDNLFHRIISRNELASLFDRYEVFLPKKRQYYIETLYSHYLHTHYVVHLDRTRAIINKKYPEYIGSFDRVMKRTSGYMFNMLIMQNNHLNNYCTWLFDILFELRNQLSINVVMSLTNYQNRFYGRISELIFNVWLDYQIREGNLKLDKIKELPYRHMEKINWWKKGTTFLNAKFTGKKYENSF